jgi:hypothetical protein
MTDTFRALCAELVHLNEVEVDDWTRNWADVIKRTKAALAQPEPQEPTDEELLELMPETMRDEFGYAAKVCSDATGGQVKPGIFRLCLNHAALEYARAVLARWGRPAIGPVAVSERLPGPEDCDAGGRCWTGSNDFIDETGDRPVPYPASWELRWILNEDTHWLPHWALPVPGVEGADA